jgi:site-specific DNA recombinase
MENQADKFFIYVRKSTGTEERQARSIGDQLAEIRELIRRDSLNIVGSFEESQSAMSKGRPLFNEMLDRIEAGEANGIIAWHPDRLARNAFDGGRIIDLIDEGKIRDLKFCTHWFEPTAQGKLMLNLAFGQSKYYSDNLSVNIRRGQRQKISEGVWSWKAPVGYLNEPKLRTIVIDPEKAPLVKMVFELYATGQYTFDRLRDTLNAKGLLSVKDRMMSAFRYQYLLQNPFYYGVFVLNGEMHEGTHEPLITKDLFDRVQDVMNRRRTPNTVRLKSYVYRGLLHCGECGCGITMETQKGHNYLRCTKRVKKDCSQPYVREESMTVQIANALSSASLPDDLADRLIRKLDAERRQGNDLMQDAKHRTEKEIEKINLKLDRLTAAYLDAGAFSAAEFRKRKAEALNAKRKLEDNIIAFDREDVLRFEPIKRFVTGSKQVKYVVKDGDPKEMRAKLENVGSNLTIRDRRLNWEPRDAWKLVVDQGSFAHVNAAPFSSAAAFVVKLTRLQRSGATGNRTPIC